jgi:3-oxoacyl-[acyl-carrier-protein] synthase-3
MRNVIIRDIARVVGNSVVTNASLVKKYAEEHNISEEKANHVLYNKLGRDKRCVADGKFTNSLMLGVSAVDKLLRQSSVDKEDIDLVIFASQFPEYTCPTQSVLLHKHCNLRSTCTSFDINANCTAGLQAISVAYSMILSNPALNKALIVASDLMSTHYQDGCLVAEGCFGDAGVALILEAVEEDAPRGFSPSLYAMTAESVNDVFYPECGGSSVPDYTGDPAKLSWNNPAYPMATCRMYHNILKLLEGYNLTSKNLDYLCCSQFTKSTGEQVADGLGIPASKIVYVGDRYGYTGVSSPLMAYMDALEDGRIVSNNLIGFTTLGLGGQVVSMLYRQ